MLFHAGAILYLNDVGVLPKITSISCVSGGALTGAFLGLRWPQLQFDEHGYARNLRDVLLDPLYALAGRTIDTRVIARGAIMPRKTGGEELARELSSRLFGSATLDDLPARPEILIATTNLESGALWTFSKTRSGEVGSPTTRSTPIEVMAPLATIVAASCAYPPLLTPVRIRLGGSGDHGQDRDESDMTFIDGGALDNLGVQAAWDTPDTLLVSDALRAPQLRRDPSLGYLKPLLISRELSEKKLRAIRIERLTDAISSGARSGAYWGLADARADVALRDSPVSPEQMRSRLARLDARSRSVVANFGYAAARAVLRDTYAPTAGSAGKLPFHGDGTPA
jgi:NTE family protein